MPRHVSRVLLALCGAVMLSGSLHATAFFQTNLASDVPLLAANPDPNLKNPWGMSFSPTSPFWVSNQGSNNATLYNGAGVPQALIVSTLPSPTGQVFNFTPSFLLPNGTKATFIFDSLSGQIAGWNGGTAAIVEASTPGAVYTGLAIGNNGAVDRLYASDFAGGHINVFDGLWAPTTVPGGFVDPNLPAGYSPYNIQAIAGKLYVQYATVAAGRPTTTANTGIVDVFDLNGNLLQRLVTNTNLNSPWGVTQAPAGFGDFANDILVGNFGDGTISAFDPTTGAFQGKISDQAGHPITNSGLWALNFRAVGSGFDPNTLFFNAGINDEVNGLFAEIQVVPEPSTFLLLALAAIPLAWRKVRG